MTKNSNKFSLSPEQMEGPRYIALARKLENMIADRELRSGDSLPPERELAEITGLSRVTIRKAVQLLVASGHLVQKRGSGTFVRGADASQDDATLSSFSEKLHRDGMTSRTIWLMRDLFPANAEERDNFKLQEGEMVARLTRVRLANERPIAIERAVLPESILPHPELLEHSLYAHLREKNLCPIRASNYVSAVNLSPRDAKLLHELTGAAGLKVRRVSFSDDGQVVEISTSIYKCGSYEFFAEETGNAHRILNADR